MARSFGYGLNSVPELVDKTGEPTLLGGVRDVYVDQPTHAVNDATEFLANFRNLPRVSSSEGCLALREPFGSIRVALDEDHGRDLCENVGEFDIVHASRVAQRAQPDPRSWARSIPGVTTTAAWSDAPIRRRHVRMPSAAYCRPMGALEVVILVVILLCGGFLMTVMLVWGMRAAWKSEKDAGRIRKGLVWWIAERDPKDPWNPKPWGENDVYPPKAEPQAEPKDSP